MVLRFEFKNIGNIDNLSKIERATHFVNYCHKVVIEKLTSFIYFDDEIWNGAIKLLLNFNIEVSTKLQPLLIAGVSTFVKKLSSIIKDFVF